MIVIDVFFVSFLVVDKLSVRLSLLLELFGVVDRVSFTAVFIFI